MTEKQMEFGREMLRRSTRMVAAMDGRLPRFSIHAGEDDKRRAINWRESPARLVAEDRVLSLRGYEPHGAGAAATYFCVAHIEAFELDEVQFGNEGQRWSLMQLSEFISRKDAVPDLQLRLKENLAGK